MMLNISFGSYYYKSLVKKNKISNLNLGTSLYTWIQIFFNQQIREGLNDERLGHKNCRAVSSTPFYILCSLMT